MPAPMASSATTASPRFDPSNSSGCTSSRLRPSWLGCFRVATISPTTRAISMPSGPLQVDGVHDARDGGVGGHFRGQKGVAGFLAARPVNQFARAGAGPIGADQALAGGFEFWREGIDKQQALALQMAVLHG